MRAARLLRTSTFRLALVYMVLFSASVLLLFGFIYWTTLRVIDRQTAATIEAEIRGLSEQYDERGLGRLIDVIEDRSGPEGDRDSVYLVTDMAYRPLAGNLSAWPREARTDGDWLYISATRADDKANGHREIRARAFLLPGNVHLLVGRNPEGRTDFQAVIGESLGWAMAVTVGLALIGGLFMSRNLMRRVEAVRETSERIVRGDLSRRVPVSDTDDELDRLAKTVNEMLDEIERLMTGMRTVTDSMAHDLRSPLTRLKGRLELALLTGAREPEHYAEALQQAIEETDGLLRTFNALTEIAQAESGASRMAMTRLDLADVMNDTLDLYRPLAETAGIVLSASIAGDTMISAHRQFLSQAVGNLMDNAIKHTPKGGSIAVEVRRDALRAMLSIEDSGSGIPPEDRDRVLQRFVRLDDSRTTPGSGLGLSLVAGVAKLHRADLVLGESRWHGLKVTLSFPLPDEDHATTRDSAPADS